MPRIMPEARYFSMWIAQRVSQFRRLLGWRHEGPWRQGARFGGQVFRDLRGLVGCAARGSRRGGACHAGEARAFAAAASRIAARPQTCAAGQADAIAILMRRTLMRTSAPILSSLRRMVPQVAWANSVSWSPIRRRAHSRT